MIPPRHGEGTRINLDSMSCAVNISIGLQPDPLIVHGGIDTPIGPMVIVGVNGTHPMTGETLCYLAQLDPDQAIYLSEKLLEHAATVIEMRGAPH